MSIDTSDNASHNQDHWLIRMPYLSIKASNGKSLYWPTQQTLGPINKAGHQNLQNTNTNITITDIHLCKYPPATAIIQKKRTLSTLQKLIAEQQLPDKFLPIPHMKQFTSIISISSSITGRERLIQTRLIRSST